jgi:hypothetical protein
MREPLRTLVLTLSAWGTLGTRGLLGTKPGSLYHIPAHLFSLSKGSEGLLEEAS